MKSGVKKKQVFVSSVRDRQTETEKIDVMFSCGNSVSSDADIFCKFLYV